MTYAWVGPFVGALIRPVGSWISDKVGGSIVTQVISAIMVGASVGVGYEMMQAYGSATPAKYSSTFRAIGVFLPPASRAGAGLYLCGCRLRCLCRPGGDWCADQG